MLMRPAPSGLRALGALLPFADQAVVAAFNLALQLAMIRLASPEDYGVFTLWQALVMVMVGFQDALVGMPLSLRIAYREGARRRLALERQVAGFTALFVAAVALFVAVEATVFTSERGDRLAMGAAVGAYAAAFLSYYAVRYLALSRADFAAALVMDTLFAVLGIGALVMLWLTVGAIPLVPLFTLLAVASAGAGVAGAIVLPQVPSPTRGRALKRYRKIWRDSRWTVLAVAAGELQNRAFVFVLSALHGPAALASVVAGSLVLRHLVVLTMAWTAFARPKILALRECGDAAAIARFIGTCGAALLVLYVVNLLALRLAWPLVESYIYKVNYPDMWPVVSLWTLVYAASVPVSCLALLLVALGRYRDDFRSVACGSVVSVIAVTTLAVTVSAQAAIAGMAIGYLVTTALMAVSARSAVATLRPEQAPTVRQ